MSDLSIKEWREKAVADLRYAAYLARDVTPAQAELVGAALAGVLDSIAQRIRHARTGEVDAEVWGTATGISRMMISTLRPPKKDGESPAP